MDTPTNGEASTAVERLVVVTVPQEPQVHEQVDHLLLTEVAPPGRPEGGEAERAELLLVPLGVGTGGEQEHDLARCRRTGVDELANPACDRARLGPAPVLARVAVGLLVGDEQLDRMPEHGIGELARGGERLVAVAELLAEDVVHGGQHLRSGAVVLGQREPLRRRPAPVTEHADVGMPEAVDRLELVADVEHLLRRPGREQVDQLALERVRVLELVDHDRPEPKLLGLAHLGLAGKQIAGEQLQILEVERRVALLAGLVLVGEEVEQLLQQVLVARRGKLERGLLDILACLLERRRPDAPRAERGEVDERLGQRGEVERGLGCGNVVLGRSAIVEEALRGLLQLLQPPGEVGGLAELELELAAGRPERLVDAREHLAEPPAAVRREQCEPLLAAGGAEDREGAVEGLAADDGAVLVVELVEARIDADREGMRAQQAAAEAVNGRDPGPVELAREIGPAAVDERGADPCAQLTRGLARVGDDEDGLDVEPLVAHCAHEPLDEHRGLPRAGPRRDEHLATGLDGRELLLVHALLTRHIVQRSHQVGHSPPFGSWATSPPRIRRAAPRPRPRAVSTWAQNSSSSR